MRVQSRTFIEEMIQDWSKVASEIIGQKVRLIVLETNYLELRDEEQAAYMSQKRIYEVVAPIVEKILGLKPGDIQVGGRKLERMNGRKMVIGLMDKVGHPRSQYVTAKLMGYKDHTCLPEHRGDHDWLLENNKRYRAQYERCFELVVAALNGNEQLIINKAI